VTRRATLLSRLAAAVSIVAVVAAIGVMGNQHLGYDGKIAPFLVPGRIGETVTTRTFDFTVQSARLARALSAAPKPGAINAPPLTTSGIWLIVHARIAARTAPVRLMSVRLHARDGDDYSAARNRMLDMKYTRWLLSENATDPGIPREGWLAFELPPSRVSGVRLRVASTFGDASLDNLTDIDLGIDEARLEELQRDAADVFVIGKDTP